MSRLVLEHLTKEFSGALAVDDLSLSVADGELLAVVGPSGGGKTTTLRMIAGLETPSRGTIRLDDRDVTHQPPRHRDMAMVFQDRALYPHLSVSENLAFPLRLRGLERREIDDRVARAAGALGLGDCLERRPAALSGGQQQRVALGRAIVRQPKCFLLDEPLSQLDGPLRDELRSEIRRLQQELGTTTVLVTHDQHEALSLGHRVAVLRDGRLQQCDTPSQVYHRPANRFVASFIGPRPMNLVDGRLTAADGQLWFEAGAFRLPVPLEHSNSLRRIVDSPIVLGVRPESLRLLPAETAGDPSVPQQMPAGTVRDVESFGECQDITLLVVGTSLVARVPADVQIACGDSWLVCLEPLGIQFFAADDPGANLLMPSGQFRRT